MKKSPALWQTVKQELITPKLFLVALPVGILYALVTLYLFNYRLLIETWFGYYPLAYKLTLMLVLLQGFGTLFTPFDLLLLTLTALLVGINTMLAISTIHRIKQQGSITLSVGGASIIGLASAGCTTCGLSLFSLFGISAAVSSLPFHGIELHILAVILLFVSLWYMLKQLHEEVYCKISSEPGYKKNKSHTKYR